MTNVLRRLQLSILLFALTSLHAPVGAHGDVAYTISPPGVVIDHMPAKDKRYIGSPSIAILPDGHYIASHDIFGPASNYSQTRVFESVDRGVSWRQIAEIKGAFWSTLFVHRGHVYLMGASKRYGDTVIRRSDDGGRNWTTPTDSKSGVLQSGGVYHCAPQPVLLHNGRIWRAMEDNRGGGGWGKHFRAFMMSAPQDADLLDATSWTISNPVARDAKWLDGKFNGWLEGNAVATPDGSIVNILRVDVPSGYGKGAIVEISDDGKTSSFDPTSGFFDMPGGSTKFTIRYDPKSQYYWSLVNQIPKRHVGQGRGPGSIRNTLALVRSKDLRQWQLRAIVAYHPEVEHHGFQYPDWQFEDGDIVAVSRTAYDDGLGGAHNYHDANFLTFHRIRDFRNVLETQLPPLNSPDGADTNTGERPNVLFIAVDDLRPELGCYGHSNVKSQNIDRFAASGRLFQRAYCQQAVCNPSRTSLMTGLRPDSIGVTGNHVHFRSNRPNVVTLSQLFMQHGYHAQSIGKIYHGVFPDGASKTTWDTMGDPASWSVPTTRFGPRYYYTESGIDQAKRSFIAMYRPSNPGPDDWTHRLVFGPMTEAPGVDDRVLYDGQVASTASDTLRKLKATGKPFFLAVGFIKPHSPFVAPKKYWDLYDPAEIRLADRTTLPVHAPAMAGHGSGEIRRYTDQPKSGDIPAVNQRRMKHGYYACISYVDAQIGRVLESLEAEGLDDNTIVVLFGDHGYHLGEHGLWGKTTNFELDTRVPFMIRVPRMNQPGRPTRSLAELVDLYPTLAELAELPVSGHLEGTSLAPIVASPTAAAPDDIAISQYPRGKAMGYSLRTDRWRYTEWIEQSTGLVVDRELYDHADDDLVETVNVASEDRYAVIADELSKRLRSEIGVDPEADRATPATGFEESQAGGFTKIANALGQWTAQEGHVEIDSAHRRSGRQCLHLHGGENRSVVLKLNTSKPDSSLVFHAERWTRRSPFQFRVEQANDGEQWQEIYRGDDVIRIGGFLTKVTVPLKGSPSSLRFTCSSPPGSGILIDDLSVVPPTRQKVVRVAVENVVVPVLVGADQNPLLHIRVEVEGTLNPISFSSTKTWLTGTVAAEDVRSVQILASDNVAQFGVAAKPFGKPRAGLGEHSFVGNHLLQHGANHFWLSCSLDKDADIDGTIQAVCESVGFSDGTTRQPVIRSVVHQLGVAVRQGGDDGVHTYRIPGLATTNKGTLIGVYDVRRRGSGDLPGDIDVGMSRSTDGGRTWEPMQVIMDMGDDPQWRYDGIGDPAVLVDRNTGTIWVAATWSHGNRSWRGSGPGLKPEETGQLMLVRSDDDGVTWSKPINITEQVKRPEWCFLLQGPGKGITMRDGTTRVCRPVSGSRRTEAAAAFDDHLLERPRRNLAGRHRSIRRHDRIPGRGSRTGRADAQLPLQPFKPVRVVMTTRDMGQTWQKHTTSERSLIEPGACMASLIDVDQEVGRGRWRLAAVFQSGQHTRPAPHHDQGVARSRDDMAQRASPAAGRRQRTRLLVSCR